MQRNPGEYNLSLSIGEYFAEATLQIGKNYKNHRWSWNKSRLGQNLKEFLNEIPTGALNTTQVSLRYFESLFDHQIGSQIAQITTRGFENWLEIKMPASFEYFPLKPHRHEAITNPDLIFGVTEKINHDGEVQIPLENPELEFLAEKLKLMKVEKLCINFLHSNKNSEHELKAGNFFKSKGFRVFLSHQGENNIITLANEQQRWLRNIFNASLSGSIEEVTGEIQAALQSHSSEVKIGFSTGQSERTSLAEENYIDSLMGSWTNLPMKESLFYLGLEKFVYATNEKTTTWNSPWGEVLLPARKVQYMRIQPTLSLEPGLFTEVHISREELGYSPGPMCFGRSRRPLLLDVLNAKGILSQLSGMSSQINTSSLTRFAETMTAYARQFKERSVTSEILVNELFERCLLRLGTEMISLNSSKKQMTLCGPLAEAFLLPLKKYFPNVEFTLLPNSEFLLTSHSTEGLAK